MCLCVSKLVIRFVGNTHAHFPSVDRFGFRLRQSTVMPSGALAIIVNSVESKKGEGGRSGFSCDSR